jgi:cell division protein FtsW (lipid II flippase)
MPHKELETTGPIGDNWLLSLAASLCVLGVVVVLTHKTQQQQHQHDVYNWKTHGIFWAVAFLVDFFLPYSLSVYAFSKFTLALVANLLPVYESVYAACTPGEFHIRSRRRRSCRS